jgi:hypothetical protein
MSSLVNSTLLSMSIATATLLDDADDNNKQAPQSKRRTTLNRQMCPEGNLDNLGKIRDRLWGWLKILLPHNPSTG